MGALDSQQAFILAHAGLRAADAGLLSSIRAAVLGPNSQRQPSPQDSDTLALAWIRDANGGNALAKLARYQTSLERSFYRALHEIQLRRTQPENPETEPVG